MSPGRPPLHAGGGVRTFATLSRASLKTIDKEGTSRSVVLDAIIKEWGSIPEGERKLAADVVCLRDNLESMARQVVLDRTQARSATAYGERVIAELGYTLRQNPTLKPLFVGLRGDLVRLVNEIRRIRGARV